MISLDVDQHRGHMFANGFQGIATRAGMHLNLAVFKPQINLVLACACDHRSQMSFLENLKRTHNPFLVFGQSVYKNDIVYKQFEFREWDGHSDTFYYVNILQFSTVIHRISNLSTFCAERPLFQLNRKGTAACRNNNADATQNTAKKTFTPMISVTELCGRCCAPVANA